MMTKGIRGLYHITALVVVVIVIYSIVDLRCTAPCNSMERVITSTARLRDDGFLQWLYNEGKLTLEPFVLKVEIGLCEWAGGLGLGF